MSEKRGMINTLGITAITFLLVSLLLGSVAVVRNNFDIRQRAAIYNINPPPPPPPPATTITPPPPPTTTTSCSNCGSDLTCWANCQQTAPPPPPATTITSPPPPLSPIVSYDSSQATKCTCTYGCVRDTNTCLPNPNTQPTGDGISPTFITNTQPPPPPATTVTEGTTTTTTDTLTGGTVTQNTNTQTISDEETTKACGISNPCTAYIAATNSTIFSCSNGYTYDQVSKKCKSIDIKNKTLFYTIPGLGDVSQKNDEKIITKFEKNSDGSTCNTGNECSGGYCKGINQDGDGTCSSISPLTKNIQPTNNESLNQQLACYRINGINANCEIAPTQEIETNTSVNIFDFINLVFPIFNSNPNISTYETINSLSGLITNISKQIAQWSSIFFEPNRNQEQITAKNDPLKKEADNAINLSPNTLTKIYQATLSYITYLNLCNQLAAIEKNSCLKANLDRELANFFGNNGSIKDCAGYKPQCLFLFYAGITSIDTNWPINISLNYLYELQAIENNSLNRPIKPIETKNIYASIFYIPLSSYVINISQSHQADLSVEDVCKKDESCILATNGDFFNDESQISNLEGASFYDGKWYIPNYDLHQYHTIVVAKNLETNDNAAQLYTYCEMKYQNINSCDINGQVNKEVNSKDIRSIVPPSNISNTETLAAFSGWPLIINDGEILGDNCINDDCENFYNMPIPRILYAVTEEGNMVTISCECNLRDDIVQLVKEYDPSHPEDPISHMIGMDSGFSSQAIYKDPNLSNELISTPHDAIQNPENIFYIRQVPQVIKALAIPTLENLTNN